MTRKDLVYSIVLSVTLILLILLSKIFESVILTFLSVILFIVLITHSVLAEDKHKQNMNGNQEPYLTQYRQILEDGEVDETESEGESE